MASPLPHYLLFCEASLDHHRSQTWRFVLEDMRTDYRFAAADSEPGRCRERLELLAVVRGLEAINSPSRVTLVTKSRYVARGLRRGLADWRVNDWSWERFGKLVPVRDSDLWQRVDRALEFHQLECRLWRFDAAISPAESADERLPLSPAEVDRQLARQSGDGDHSRETNRVRQRGGRKAAMVASASAQPPRRAAPRRQAGVKSGWISSLATRVNAAARAAGANGNAQVGGLAMS